MRASPFSAEIRAGRQAGAATILLHGELDATAEPDLQQAFGQATAGRAGVVTLDFSDVSFMNSTGIALIVELLSEAQRDGRKLQALGLSPHYREIFEITRLSEFIQVLNDGQGGGVMDLPTAATSPATSTTTGGKQ